MNRQIVNAFGSFHHRFGNGRVRVKQTFDQYNKKKNCYLKFAKVSKVEPVKDSV